MDKTTGESLQKGGKEIFAETWFVPGAPCGTAEVRFTLDASELGDRNLVVFEKLFAVKTGTDGKVTENLIAVHEDLQAEEQTIYVRERKQEEPEKPEKPQHPEIPKQPVNPEKPAKTTGREAPAEVPKTGDAADPILYILLLTASVCILTKLCCAYKKK